MIIWHPYFSFFTVGDWWERDDVSLCIHEAGVERLALQNLQISTQRIDSR